MPSILDLGPAQCRYALTDDSPHDFCGRPTARVSEPYCPEHARLCRVGRVGWRELERLIDGVDRTVVAAPARNGADHTEGVDTYLRSGKRGSRTFKAERPESEPRRTDAR